MLTPPVRKQLPRHVEPRKLVAQCSSLSGDAPTAEMTRLADAVISMDEGAQVELHFFRDQEGHATVEGKVGLDVTLQCQRCLQPVHKTLAAELHLGIAWDEDRADKLPQRLEPWIVDTDVADLFSMVEDELLLALPIVAYHDADQCPGTTSYSTGQFEDAAENPFGILAQLKTRQ